MGLFLDFEYQIAIPAFILLFLISLVLFESLIHKLKQISISQKIQADSQLELVANLAIQQAIMNFVAGRVAQSLVDGEMSKNEALRQLHGYLLKAVPDAMTLLDPDVDILETIMLGNIGMLSGIDKLPQIVDSTIIATR